MNLITATVPSLLNQNQQAEINITGRNIKQLRYAGDTTLMAKAEELKSFLMKVNEENEKAGLKFNIPKTKITVMLAPWNKSYDKSSLSIL